MKSGQETAVEGGDRITKLYGETEIADRVAALAREIAEVVPRDVLVVGLLKGSFMFVADLVRALHPLGLSPKIEFVRLSSYGMEKKSSGSVRLIGALPGDLAGKPVLLVDDIVDTGRSMAKALDLLSAEGAGKVWTCALTDKPSRREIDFEADFVGFTVPDLFVVGYGIDYAEKHRHLPYIGTVD